MCKKSWQVPAKKPARNSSCPSVVWGLIFLVVFEGEVAEHSHKQELWPLGGKLTALLDSCRQIFDANNLLILLPYNPHSVCCLNIPLVWLVQIRQVLGCSFPVLWALVNCFIKVILKPNSTFWKRKAFKHWTFCQISCLSAAAIILEQFLLQSDGSECMILLVSISILFRISCLFWTVHCSTFDPKSPYPDKMPMNLNGSWSWVRAEGS